MEEAILVPLDRSKLAERALAPAAELAAASGAALELVLVHAPLPGLGSSDDGLGVAALELDRRIRQDQEEYLNRVVARLSGAARAVRATVLDGPVARTLAEYVESRAPRLVVMTTHGRGGVSRLVLGSVADRLIRRVHRPVLLLRPARPAARLAVAEWKRILIPLDGSGRAEAVIDQAVTALPGGPVILELVQVVVPPSAAALGSPAAGGFGFLERLQLLANHYLHSVAARLRQRGFTVQVQAIVGSDVVHEILTYAKDHRCDLIALATHALGPIERGLLGSVADKLIRKARLPVLVWNPPAGARSELLPVEAARASAPAGPPQPAGHRG